MQTLLFTQFVIEPTNITEGDIEAAAIEGLCRAALNYDHREKAQFATYLFMYVFKAVNDTIRLIRGSESLSVDDECLTDDDGNTVNPLPEPTESPFEDIDNQEYVSHLLERLTPREQRVIRYTFGLNGGNTYSVKEIAAMEQMSGFQVRRCVQTALARLRTFIAKP